MSLGRKNKGWYFGMKKETEQNNIEKIAAYFKEGEKTGNLKTGVEIEHFVIGKDGNSMSYETAVEFMEALMDKEDRGYFEDGHLLGFFSADYSISLEPAAQVEISIAPKETIAEIEKVYKTFRSKADGWLEEKGFRLVNCGYHPQKKVSELSLIPKMRYEYMDRYFEKTGRYGKNMMRATASTQVSIDYENEADFVEKYRLACMLSPLFALLTDRSPVFEGKPVKTKLVRTVIWMNTDDIRCGIFPGTFAEDFGYRKYAEYLYNCPPILIMDETGKAVETKTKTFRELYADREMTKAEIEHAVSMVFPDVRLKNYIEIRVADSMELPEVLQYTALIKTCFYKEQARRELYELLGSVDEEKIKQAKRSVIEKGFDGELYGKNADFLTEELYRIMEKYGDGETKQYLQHKEQAERKQG